MIGGSLTFGIEIEWGKGSCVGMIRLMALSPDNLYLSRAIHLVEMTVDDGPIVFL